MVLAEGEKIRLVAYCLLFEDISPVGADSLEHIVTRRSVASWLLRSLLLCLGFISTVENSELQRRLVGFFLFVCFQRSQSAAVM